VPQVESQSLQPDDEAGVIAEGAAGENCTGPPLRGMAAPSFGHGRGAGGERRGPPTIQTPMNIQTLGRSLATSPGVRTMPAADGVADRGGHAEPHAKDLEQAARD